MRSDGRINQDHLSNNVNPLKSLMVLAASAVNALTVALIVLNDDRDKFIIIGFHSLSDHFISDAELPLTTSIQGNIFRRGVPVHEACFEGDSSTLGIYSEQESIMAYMAAPVGTRGVLWIDTRKAKSFSDNHLKILLGLARTAQNILELTERVSGHKWIEADLDLIRELLNEDFESTDSYADFFDIAVRLIVDRTKLDGALVAVVLPEKGLCRVLSCQGFSPILKKGRIIRIKQGWIQWALDKQNSVIISGLRGEERSLTIFHPGETIGFEPKSLAVIPWSGLDDCDHGVLVLASRKPSPRFEEGRQTWQFIGHLAGLIRTVSYYKKLIQGVRKYDGESGLLSEGYFRHQTRIAISRVRDRKSNLFLLLVLIENMDELYLALDYSLVRRFLEIFAEKLRILTKRTCLTGKFMTGGFGLMVENLPSDEIRTVTKKAETILGTGRSVVDGNNIHYEVKLGTALFPDECSDLHGLWRKASESLMNY